MPSSKPMTYDKVVERKQRHYRDVLKPSLQNEADMGSFLGGGRSDKVVNTIMQDRAYKQAKASHGRAPIVVDVAFRDDSGIHHYDEESALQFDPLLMPGTPAAHAPQYPQAYPAWIDMQAARRGSVASVGSSESGHYVPYADPEELQSAFGGVAPSKAARSPRKQARRGSVPLNLSDPYATAPAPVSSQRQGGAYTHDARRDFLASSFAPPPLAAPMPMHSPTSSHYAPPPTPTSSHSYSQHSHAHSQSQAPFDSRRVRRFTLTSSSTTNVSTMRERAPPPMPSMPHDMYGHGHGYSASSASMAGPGSSSASVKSSKSAVKNIFRMGRKA